MAMPLQGCGELPLEPPEEGGEEPEVRAYGGKGLALSLEL